MELILTAAEATELRALVESAIPELRSELHHTSSSDYRRELHARELVLHGLLERLRAADEPAAASAP